MGKQMHSEKLKYQIIWLKSQSGSDNIQNTTEIFHVENTNFFPTL